MNIETVKIQSNGWLLNGTMSVPMADGNADYEAIKQWLAEGNTPEPQYTEEELQAIESAKAVAEAKQAKQAKELALNSSKVTTASGKVFDGRDKDQVRMMAAIQASTVLGTTDTQWKLADNTVATVTLEELKEALVLSIQAVGEVIIVGVE